MNESNTTTNTIPHIDQSRFASTRPQGCVDAQDRLNVPKNKHDRIVLTHLRMSQLVIAEAGVLAQLRGWSMSKVVQEAVEHYLRCEVPRVGGYNSLTIHARKEEPNDV